MIAMMSSFDVYPINNCMPFRGGGTRALFTFSILSPIQRRFTQACSPTLLILYYIMFFDGVKENAHLMIGFEERKSCLISLKRSIKNGKYEEDEVAKERCVFSRECRSCVARDVRDTRPFLLIFSTSG